MGEIHPRIVHLTVITQGVPSVPRLQHLFAPRQYELKSIDCVDPNPAKIKPTGLESVQQSKKKSIKNLYEIRARNLDRDPFVAGASTLPLPLKSKLLSNALT